MITESLAKLKNYIDSLPDKFSSIPDEIFLHKPRPEKWSKKEIIGHLVDSAFNNIQRFVRMQHENNTVRVVYYQDDWVLIQNHQDQHKMHLISLWKLLNQQIVHIVKNTPEANYEIMCDTGKEETSLHSFSFLVTDYVDHLEHHLRQIFPDEG